MSKDAKMCLKNYPRKVEKKHPSLKSSLEIVKEISLLPWTAQMAQLMFQNVAFRSTVYKTGAVTT